MGYSPTFELRRGKIPHSDEPNSTILPHSVTRMRNGQGKEIEIEQAHFQAVFEAFYAEASSPRRIAKCHQINKECEASTSHHSILPHRSHPPSRRRRFFLFALLARHTQLQLPYCNELRQSVCGCQQIHASNAPYQTARRRGRLQGDIRRRCH